MNCKIFYPTAGFVAGFTIHAIYLLWRGIQIPNQCVRVSSLSLYFRQQDFLLGFSYALAGAFTMYAFLKFLERSRGGVAGVIGGITLTGILYLCGCFLLGCCGSPMLAVYLSLFGASFLGFTKLLVLILTMISVVIGYFWMERKTKTSKRCCTEDKKCEAVNCMAEKDYIEKIQSELREGMRHAKCRRCGCMKETLENLRSALSPFKTTEAAELLKNIESWVRQMEAIKYSCLGCDYCFPAVAMNVFNQAFPEAADAQSLSCGFEVKERTWPPVPGEYFASCKGWSCPVAVSTLASTELAEALAKEKPRELCIVGKTETENIGIDKVIKNTITNPTIRAFILAGKDPEGHHSGKTLYALYENGVDENMRIIGSPGRRPVLRNVTRSEVETFRKQVKMVDMIGCEAVDTIIEQIKELSQEISSMCIRQKPDEETKTTQISTVPIIHAKEPGKIELDKSGYFVIIPQPEKGIITVEHYSYDNKLHRIIEGRDARSTYLTVIENGWITQLSHAAYLGKELAKAELSMKLGFKYVQDGA